MKKIQDLEERVQELTREIAKAHEEAASAMGEGRPAEKVLEKIAHLTTERDVTGKAIEITRQREAEEAERKAQETRDQADKEVEKLRIKATDQSRQFIDGFLDLCKLAAAMKGTIAAGNNLITAHGLKSKPLASIEAELWLAPITQAVRMIQTQNAYMSFSGVTQATAKIEEAARLLDGESLAAQAEINRALAGKPEPQKGKK